MNDYDSALDAVARKFNQTFLSVRLLAGIGVTHEYVATEGDRPGYIGANPRWQARGAKGCGRTRRESVEEKLSLI